MKEIEKNVMPFMVKKIYYTGFDLQVGGCTKTMIPRALCGMLQAK